MASVREFAITHISSGLRTLDGSSLSWSPTGLSSHTLDGIVVLTNNPQKSECNWKVVHAGEGTIVTTAPEKKDLVIQKKTAAFTLQDPITLCGLEVHPTTDPLVFVSNTSGLAIPKIDHLFQGSLNTLLRAGLAGQDFVTKLAMGTTTQTILRNQCLLEQMVRTSIVQTARKHPELAALTITGSPGWILYPAGHGVRLKACAEFPVAIIEQPTCHADIPVQLENTSQVMYMDALTRTLLPSSYEISCTDPTLPIVKIRSTLYTLAPHLTPLPGISPLQSRLLGVDRSWMAPGDRLYPDEIIFALNRPDDHMSRKSEVERQLIKLGDGSFQQVQDSLGVFDSLKPIAPKIMSSYSLIKYNGQIHRTRQYQMTTTQSLPRVKVQGSISDGVFQIVYDISLAGTVLLFLFLLLCTVQMLKALINIIILLYNFLYSVIFLFNWRRNRGHKYELISLVLFLIMTNKFVFGEQLCGLKGLPDEMSVAESDGYQDDFISNFNNTFKNISSKEEILYAYDGSHSSDTEIIVRYAGFFHRTTPTDCGSFLFENKTILPHAAFGYNDNRDFYLMSKFPTQTKSKKLVFHVRNTIKYVTQQIQTMDFLEQAQTYTYQLGTVKMCSNIHYLLKYITVQP